MNSEQDYTSAGTPSPEQVEDGIHRSQDFTVGHWDMYDGEEKIAEFVNDLVLGGRAISQRMDIAAGGSAIGLTAYSPALKVWHYLLTSDVGITTLFTGIVTSPGDAHTTQAPLDDGRTKHRKWSLTLKPDGNVRELSVASEDDSQTWTTEYDLLWVKHESKL
ncbi:MAG: hypothetical protein IPF97_06365 [Sphingomonadales bacterium]|nr:hypothetical protein [Sphingomonadales bacterium]